MKKLALKWIFNLGALLFAMVGLYHFIGIFYEVNNSSPSRHAIFVAINMICIYGILKRPSWFIYFFLVLSIQQYCSHGGFLIRQWVEHQKVDWISVFVLMIAPLILYALFKEKKGI